MGCVRSREDGHLASFEGEVGWEVWSQKSFPGETGLSLKGIWSLWGSPKQVTPE